jgi:catechol 2,3-dioxygenase-like lactoylglutathione lyase family enzyme
LKVSSTRGVARVFYVGALGLEVGRRLDKNWAELVGAPIPIDLLKRASGTPMNPPPDAAFRSYERHWTPVHLDFVVEDLDATVERVRAAGGALEGDIQTYRYGRFAGRADPFAHGFCLLEFHGRGYDELLDS